MMNDKISETNKPLLPFGWIVQHSRSYPDRIYYFNINTGVSTWELPELAKPHMQSKGKNGPKSKCFRNSSLTQHFGVAKVSPESIHKFKRLSQEQITLPTKEFCKTSSDNHSVKNPGAAASNHAGTQSFGYASFSGSGIFLSSQNSCVTGLQNKKYAAKKCNSEITGACHGDGSIFLKKIEPKNSRAFDSNEKNPVQKGFTEKNHAVIKSYKYWRQNEGQHQNINKKNYFGQDQPKCDSCDAQKQSLGCSFQNVGEKTKEQKQVCSNFQNSSCNGGVRKRESLPDSPKMLQPTCDMSFGRQKQIKTKKKAIIHDELDSKLKIQTSHQQSLDVFQNDSLFSNKSTERIDANDKGMKSKKNNKGANRERYTGKLVKKQAKKKKNRNCTGMLQDVMVEAVNKNNHIKSEEKLSIIQSWIDSIDSGHSTLDSGSVKSEPGIVNISRPITYNEDLAGMSRNYTADSGYSTISEAPRGGTSLVILSSSATSIPMEIDEEEDENMAVDLQEVREKLKSQRDEVVGQLTKSVSCENAHISTTNNEQALLIVIDTNVLLNDLNIIEELKDHSLTVFGKPTLVIPWVVMQELDTLKNSQKNTQHTNKAHRAVQFLFSCFESKHPRIIGQSPKEAKESVDIIAAESNDDRVLQCCLQYKQKCFKSLVTLYTNDKNLCSKALISEVKAFTRQTLLFGLAELAGCIQNEDTLQQSIPQFPITDYQQDCTLPAKSPSSSKCNYPSSFMSRRDNEIRLADEVSCKLKAVLRESLAILLESEMRAVYEELWIEIVYRKPPWTLKDLLDCFLKHWIAVFGIVFKRENKVKFEKLSEHFVPGSGYGRKIRQVCCRVDDGISVLEDCKFRADCGDAIQSSLILLHKLKHFCREILNLKIEPSSATTLNDYLGDLAPVTISTNNVQSVKSKLKPKPQSMDVQPSENEDLQIAQDTFQKVWESINDYCQSIQQSLQTETPTYLEEVIVPLLMKLIPIMKNLHHHFACSLAVPVDENETLQFVSLANELNNFFKKMEHEVCHTYVTGSQLQKIFFKSDKRLLLENGLMQLDSMVRMLYSCVKLLPGSEHIS